MPKKDRQKSIRLPSDVTDATEKLARAEDRDYEPADQLLARILAERHARWEAERPGKRYKEPALPDAENLPKLPEGWIWAGIEQLTDLSSGKAFKKSEYSEKGN